MNLAGQAIDRRATAFMRTRRATGGYNDDGDYVPGGATSGNILAIVQPASGRQMMDLPEGIRTEARWLIWSRAELRIDDVVQVGSEYHRLIYLWPRAEGEFYRAAMGEVAP